jgi:hypothetical protein
MSIADAAGSGVQVRVTPRAARTLCGADAAGAGGGGAAASAAAGSEATSSAQQQQHAAAAAAPQGLPGCLIAAEPGRGAAGRPRQPRARSGRS